MLKVDELSPERKMLILTMGLPYSGKTTWAKKTGYPIVNPDSIRVATHGHRYIQDTEELVWAITRIMIRSLFMAGHHTVVLDATNMKEENRRKWYTKQWSVNIMRFDTPVEECINRARANNDEEIIPIIERMNMEREDAQQ